MRSAQAIREDLARCVLHLRSGRADCRRSLAKQLQLAASTAGHYVEQLLAAGLISEDRAAATGRGRPRRLLRVAGRAGWFAGVEFHAQRVQAVAVDFAGRMQASQQTRLPAAVTTRQILAEITRLVRSLKRMRTEPLLGLGVGVPGVVDPDAGIARHDEFVTDWRDVPVAARLGSRLRVPVTLENNLRAIAFAERWLGAGRELSDFVVLGPRSGFGLALVLGGQLRPGAHLAAGAVGHWPIAADSSGQLHDRLAAPAIWRRLTGRSTRSRLPSDLRAALAEAAGRASSAMRAVIRDYACLLGRLHLLLDASAYLLHGPLTGLGPAFCEAVAQEAVRQSPQLASRPPRFLLTTLGDDAGAVGAACQAMEAWRPPAPP